jgi:hypothetical protein
MKSADVVSFLSGPALVTITYYLSAAPVERGVNLAFSFILSIVIGAWLVVMRKIVCD